MGFRIYGHSDDVVVLDTEGVQTEVQTHGRGIRFTFGTAKEGGLVVEVRYGVDEELGVWTTKLHQIDEGVPIPWTIGLTEHPVTGFYGKPAKSYSLCLNLVGNTTGVPVAWERVP